MREDCQATKEDQNRGPAQRHGSLVPVLSFRFVLDMVRDLLRFSLIETVSVSLQLTFSS